jgi:hypothetical protein
VVEKVYRKLMNMKMRVAFVGVYAAYAEAAAAAQISFFFSLTREDYFILENIYVIFFSLLLLSFSTTI